MSGSISDSATCDTICRKSRSSETMSACAALFTALPHQGYMEEGDESHFAQEYIECVRDSQRERTDGRERAKMEA
eukprot:2650400-Rhodomonas_salina.3